MVRLGTAGTNPTDPEYISEPVFYYYYYLSEDCVYLCHFCSTYLSAVITSNLSFYLSAKVLWTPLCLEEELLRQSKPVA